MIRRQTPHFVSSDLGLHCLRMSHKKDTRSIWVKMQWLDINLDFSYFSTKTYVEGTQNRLNEFVLLSTHNLC